MSPSGDSFMFTSACARVHGSDRESSPDCKWVVQSAPRRGDSQAVAMAVEGDEAEISPMLSAAASDVDCGLSGFTQSTATTTVRTHHHLTAHRQSAR